MKFNKQKSLLEQSKKGNVVSRFGSKNGSIESNKQGTQKNQIKNLSPELKKVNQTQPMTLEILTEIKPKPLQNQKNKFGLLSDVQSKPSVKENKTFFLLSETKIKQEEVKNDSPSQTSNAQIKKQAFGKNTFALLSDIESTPHEIKHSNNSIDNFITKSPDKNEIITNGQKKTSNTNFEHALPNVTNFGESDSSRILNRNLETITDNMGRVIKLEDNIYNKLLHNVSQDDKKLEKKSEVKMPAQVPTNETKKRPSKSVIVMPSRMKIQSIFGKNDANVNNIEATAIDSTNLSISKKETNDANDINRPSVILSKKKMTIYLRNMNSYVKLLDESESNRNKPMESNNDNEKESEGSEFKKITKYLEKPALETNNAVEKFEYYDKLAFNKTINYEKNTQQEISQYFNTQYHNLRPSNLKKLNTSKSKKKLSPLRGRSASNDIFLRLKVEKLEKVFKD